MARVSAHRVKLIRLVTASRVTGFHRKGSRLIGRKLVRVLIAYTVGDVVNAFARLRGSQRRQRAAVGIEDGEVAPRHE